MFVTECDEIADVLQPTVPRFTCFDDAIRFVTTQMPAESVQIVDNVAFALYRAQAAA